MLKVIKQPYCRPSRRTHLFVKSFVSRRRIAASSLCNCAAAEVVVCPELSDQIRLVSLHAILRRLMK